MHLHLQTVESNSNVYNKNLYLQELNSIQNRFKSDLEAIKAKFTKINEELKQTNASSSSQVIKLQETLAEERDALYNVQKYLSLPFALKSCECLNFTDAQKK
jgi:DNA repair ATPase RecN